MREYINLYEIYKTHRRPEIDYLRLVSFLGEMSQPRQKIRKWLQKGDLIRIKKGLYLFSKKIIDVPYSKETLAALIYGPSALSLEYALSYYGLIPERVDTLTSITPKRDKIFTTSIGVFTYKYLSQKQYHLGLKLIQDREYRYFMASPEKALFDQVTLQAPVFNKKKDLEIYLKENLRLDWGLVKKLDMKQAQELALVYNKKNIRHFIKILKESKNDAN